MAMYGRPSLDMSNGHSDNPFLVSSTMNTTSMNAQLAKILDEKETELQLAGNLGQRILQQRVELEERINVLSEYEHRSGSRTPEPGGDPEMTRKFQELQDLLQSWDKENQETLGGFNGQKLSNGPSSARPPQTPLTPSASPQRSVHRELPPDPEPDFSFDTSVASVPSAAQSSRRAKNAAHRENDVKFAYDIGTSLLTEVRRLQALLSERDKTIQDMKAEKDDVDKENDNLQTSLHQQEASADKFKEENWNLEVQIQETRTQLQAAQQSATRAEAEVRRTAKQLAATRETVESQKSENERVSSALEDLRAKHETDVAQMRKQAATLNRDKSDLQASLDTLKSDMAKRERNIKQRFGSPMGGTNAPTEVATPNNMDRDDDLFTGGASRRKLEATPFLTPGAAFGNEFDSSPEPSPSRPAIVLGPNHPSNELEALKQALAHAHRQIGTLKGTIQREKEQKLQYKKQLGKDALLTLPNGWEDEDDEQDDEKPLRTVSSRGRGMNRPTRGRGGKILTLAQKLGLATVERRTSIDEWEDDSMATAQNERDSLLDEDVERSPTKPLQEEDHEPSPFIVSSRPTSVDGMDPAFANVLRSTSEPAASPHGPSPLARQEEPVSPSAKLTAAAVRLKKSRGGAGFKARPDSIVAPPSSLGNELDNFSGDDQAGYATAYSTVLEELEDETRVPEPAKEIVAVPKPVYADMCVQAEPVEEEKVPEPTPIPLSIPIPVPEPVHVPVIETAEMSIQTDEPAPPPPPAPPVLPVYFEQAVETDGEVTPVLPMLVDTGMETDAPVTPPVKEMVEMDIQTDDMQEVEIQLGPPAPVLDVEIRSMVTEREEVERPGTLSRPTVPFPIRTSLDGEADSADEAGGIIKARTPRVLSMASTRTARPVAMIFEDPEDDSLAETETDGEYADARESIAAMTPHPAESIQSFHSAANGSVLASDSEQSDAESIKASRLAVRQSYSSLSNGRRLSRPKKEPAHGAAAAGPAAGAIAVVTVDPPPKPELKEMSIQTDEWVPEPAPVVLPLPVPPSPSRSFHRVGSATVSNAPPFQFISSPARNADRSFTSAGTATPTPVSSQVTKAPPRDSTGTFGGAKGRSQTPKTDRRLSIESAFSQAEDATKLSPSRTPAAPPTPIDRTRPPTMMVPPPPSMPPPAIIPINKKIAMAGNPPPRPTSPPPAELIQRATTPTFQRPNTPSLLVPGSGRVRQHGSSLPPNAQGLRQPPSTGSFRSAADAAQRSPLAAAFNPSTMGRRGERSMTSLLSGGSSAIISRRASVSSSKSSELDHPTSHPRTPSRPVATTKQSTTPANETPQQGEGDAEDEVIQSITQTMIGEFLYKYTRRVVGKGHGEKRHKRFVWVHPYTKTIYWSSVDPGSSSANESSAKSAYIDSVKSVLDPNPVPPGIHQYSIVVSTPQRDMKFTAMSKERHDIWFKALNYLLIRPSTVPVAEPSREQLQPPASPMRHRKFSTEVGSNGTYMTSPQSVRSVHSGHSYSITPRAMKSQTQLSHQGSLGKRPGTAAAEYLRWAEDAHSPTRSIRSYRQAHPPTADDDDYENVDAAEESFELHDEPFEAMENVRACCDGEHDLGTLSRRPDSRQQVHHHHHAAHLQPRSQTPIERPNSPSAWSFRSKAGSTQSEKGSRLSQWAGDAKRSIRFTSRGKSPATRPPLPGVSSTLA
ncbi:hypothetical protein FRB97_008362 [Tulasnella sp. 331]|nr:hypothetical protein FRB97_008362 [Tulasnella sp. 331]KAG8886815.1 hypothetical protein FRB98_000951 [Tulasnella sp. 332]